MVLTSDQGVVYHLKHGLSKQVVSSSGFSLPPHTSSSKTWNLPPLMPTHCTSLRFTPRPQVVLHYKKKSQSGHFRAFEVGFYISGLYVEASPSPSLGAASAEHSLSPHRGGWPVACSLRSTGSQEPRDPLEPYSTRDALSSPGHTTLSTATDRSHTG